ncbi:MAG: ATP-binding protein [Gammaproteobacteria bacterium]|nr:ATP-binding protein [Gammaproteobacteria bacterium]
MTFTHEHIRKRMLIPIFFTFFLIILVSISTIYILQSRHVAETGIQKIKSAQKYFEHQILQDTNFIKSSLAFISKNTTLQDQWLKQDKDALFSAANEIYRQLHTEYKITHFYFIQKDKICFLRVHNPERFGDTIQRYTLTAAETTNKISAGIELGVFGTFTLRVVLPWYINNEFVGYLELGREIDHITPKIKEALNVEFLVAIKKSLLDENKWQEGTKMMGVAGDWDAFPDYVFVDSTTRNHSFVKLSGLGNRHTSPTSLSQRMASHRNKTYSIGQIPLFDINETHVGELVIFFDITRERSTLIKFAIALTFVCVLISIGLFLIFYRYIGGIEYKLNFSINKVNEETKAREAALIHAKTVAEDSSRMKSEFLANMSHEIRTPMNGVLGMMNLLDETRLTNEQKNFVRIASSSGETLLNIVNDILDLSKIEAGKFVIENIKVDIRQLIEDVALSFAQTAFRKSLEFNCIIKKNVPQFILSDPSRVRQVLNNILGNAVKFTEKGEVRLEANVEIDDQMKQWFTIHVSDTGIGMDDVIINIIFQPFTQADGSTTRKFGGTGLGLTISKRLVEMMQGTMQVSSRPEVGSTFCFRIPLQSESSDTSLEYAGQQINSAYILLVNTTAMMQDIIHEDGFSFVSINSEADLVRLMETKPSLVSSIKIALLDQVRNEHSLKLVTFLKNKPSLKHIRVICIGEFSSGGELQGQFDSFCEATLNKPILPSSIAHLLLDQTNASNEQESRSHQSGSDLTGQYDFLLPVLVVEDDRVNQKVIQSMLAKMNVKVEVVSNGQEAIDSLDRRKFGLIFMDCQMPIMDGYEATKHIRAAKDRYGYIPIIALTANVQQSDRDKCVNAGMNDFVTKPVNMKTIETKLKRWMADANNSSLKNSQ